MFTSPDTAESHVRVGGKTAGLANAADAVVAWTDVVVAPTVLSPVHAAIAIRTTAMARCIP
jgi:hypothetical protein